MSQIFALLVAALNSTPTAIIPFIITLGVIAYLSYKTYIEFKAVYKKCNADKLELTNRIAKVETSIAMSDEKTLVLSQKLQRIEESLDRMNITLTELATTLKIMREQKK